MTAPTPEAPTTTEKKQGLPGWLAIAAILFAIAIGATILWKFIQGLQVKAGGAVVVLDEKPSERAAIEAQQRGQFWQRQRAERQANLRKQELEAPDFLRPRPNNQPGWIAKGNKTRLIIQKNNTGQLRINADSMDPDFIPPEVRAALSAAVRITSDDALAKQLALTPEQKKTLTALPRNSNYPLDPPTRKSLEALFTTWEKSPEAGKPAASAALTTALRALESAQAEKLRQSLLDAAATIKSTLTPDQLKGLGL